VSIYQYRRAIAKVQKRLDNIQDMHWVLDLHLNHRKTPEQIAEMLRQEVRWVKKRLKVAAECG
jgi:hypothetical protein